MAHTFIQWHIRTYKQWHIRMYSGTYIRIYSGTYVYTVRMYVCTHAHTYIIHCRVVTSRVVQIQTYYYSQTSLVSTPEDPPNCYSLSVGLANHIHRLVLWVISWGIISLYFLTRYYLLTVFLLTRFYCT